jgi:acyl-CoA oxidase
VFARLLID